MSGDTPGGGYVPIDVDAAVPADPATRAAREAEIKARQAQEGAGGEA